MRLETFESKYGDFFVPTSVIRVGGQDIVRELFLTVTSVSVELKLNAAARFSFTITSAFDWEKHEFLGGEGLDRVDLLKLFKFGSSVEVAIGYGKPGGLRPIIGGIITEIGTSFAEAATPNLVVSGYDSLFALGLGASTRQWIDKPRSYAAAAVAEKNGLRSQITAKDKKVDRIDQCKESDFAFIEKMAKLAESIFYVREGTLHFGPARKTANAAIELVWGEGLSSFAPSANLAGQFSEVHLHGRAAVKGEDVVGIARQSDTKGVDGDASSALKHVDEAIPQPRILSVSAAIHTKQEADDRAKAILEKHAQKFVTADGECVGLPELAPDMRIAVSGVGEAFSKPYYVAEAVHSLDAKGYRTKFKVERPAI